jgi:hypothetical protein
MITLDLALVDKSRRYSHNSLPERQLISLNLFRRLRVKMAVLARAFRLSKNTIYDQATTGDNDLARRINAIVDAELEKMTAMPRHKALVVLLHRYASDGEIDAVNKENAREAARKEAIRVARRRLKTP